MVNRRRQGPSAIGIWVRSGIATALVLAAVLAAQWAKLWLVLPIAGDGKDRALGVARKVHGRWRIVTVGSAGVGCGLPPAVAADLHLDTSCF